LTDMHETGMLMHMRTTLNIDDALLENAMRLTGLREKTAVVRAGLEALIRRESAKRLIALGGTDPGAKLPAKRRPPDFRRP
jgi:Arc/MetJ family transcription regulator